MAKNKKPGQQVKKNDYEEEDQENYGPGGGFGGGSGAGPTSG